LQVSDGKAAYKLRAAALAAGFPNTAGASSLNRFCSSGLKAIADIAHSISSGSIEVGIAAGAELMSVGGDRLEAPFDEAVLAKSQEAADCMEPMGWTSENVSRDFGITREEMDKFAAESFRRAEHAQKEGWSVDEIAPIKTKVKGADGEWTEVTVTKDDGIRPGTTAEGLGKIRAAFPQWGPTTTGGNASQVTDGGELLQSGSYCLREERSTCFLLIEIEFCFCLRPNPRLTLNHGSRSLFTNYGILNQLLPCSS
jgi:acetyl-CoA acyltransferase 1